MNYLPTSFAGIFGMGAPELILILIILLVLFGGAKLPSLARGLGESIREFKKASKEDPEEAKKAEAAKGEAAKPEATKADSAKEQKS